MTLSFVLMVIGALVAFLACQYALSRLAAKEDQLAAQAMEQTLVYSREGAAYWLDEARFHEDRAKAFRRVSSWPLKPKERQ